RSKENTIQLRARKLFPESGPGRFNRRTFRFLMLLFTVAAGAVCAQTPGDWPQFRFDSARSGANPAETTLSVSSVAGLNQKWTFQTDGLVVASPAVVNGVVYVPSGNGTFYALNATTGALIWKRAITGSSSS